MAEKQTKPWATPQFDPHINPPTKGAHRNCDLCPFEVWHEEPLVVEWALRSHMYEKHPSKGAEVYMKHRRRR